MNDKTVDIFRTFHQAHLQLKGFCLLLIVAFGASPTATSTLQTFIESMTAYMEVLHHYTPQAHNQLASLMHRELFRYLISGWERYQD